MILDMLHDWLYWARMPKDAEAHMVSCDGCIHFKRHPDKAAMENIQATHLLQLVHLDYLTIEVTEGGKYVHVLVITDDFMWYAQTLVTLPQTAKCTAKVL